MNVKAINDNIIVTEIDNTSEGLTSNVIVTGNLNKFRKGTVTSVGKDIKHISVGMIVSYDKDAVYRVSLDNTEVNKKTTIAVLKEPDVYAIMV